MNVIVSGMGAMSILGKGLSEHAQRLFYKVKDEENQISPYLPRRENLAKTPPDLRMIPLEEEKKYYESLLQLKLSRNVVLALMAFDEAFRNSAWTLEALKKKKIAIVLGTTAGCSGTDTAYIEEFVMDRSPDPKEFKISLKQNPSEMLKKYLLTQGVDASVDLYLINNACTSATDAVGLGSKFVDKGTYDVVFAGGTDEVMYQTYYGFSSLQLVSQDFRSSPFDKNRNGLFLSEGGAILCLESEKTFKERGGKKYNGSILAYESTTETFHQTSPSPDADGLHHVTSEVLRKARLDKSDVDFINAHATGTLANDFSEGSFFVKNFPGTKVSATKGYTGHCLGAVGALEAIFCFQSMEEKKLPASYGFTEVDPAIGLKPVATIESVDFQKTPVALSTSVGFGGVNSALLLKGVAP